MVLLIQKQMEAILKIHKEVNDECRETQARETEDKR